VTPTEPRDALHHVQSTIALYIKLDAKCDRQVTVVGRQSTAFGHVHRRQVLSTSDRRTGRACRGQTFESPSRVRSKVTIGSTHISEGILISLKHNAGQLEGNPYGQKKRLAPCSRFYTILACNRHTDMYRHRSAANTRVTWVNTFGRYNTRVGDAQLLQ